MLFLQIPEGSLQGYEMHETLVLAKYQVLQGRAFSFNKTPVCAVWHQDRLEQISSHHIRCLPRSVLQWACLVNRIWSYEGVTRDTLVCTFRRIGGRLDTIASSQVLMRLRAAATAIGSARLGFEPKEIGTHSLCLGAAMEMYLVGVPVYTIMLIGRWSSDAFLCYIRKQVEQFS
jgi:hypothetical protein